MFTICGNATICGMPYSPELLVNGLFIRNIMQVIHNNKKANLFLERKNIMIYYNLLFLLLFATKLDAKWFD